MIQDEIIEMAREAGFEIDCCSLEWHKRITAFAKLVAAKERESYKHDMEVLTNALWKACGDDEEVVKATIESQGTLTARGQA